MEGVPYFGPPTLKAQYTLSKPIIDGCVQSVCDDDYKLLFINAYMPYESDNVACNEYSAGLADIDT